MKQKLRLCPVQSVTLLLFLTSVILLIVQGCHSDRTKKESSVSSDRAATLEGELIIFHAGSLAVPFKEIRAAFRKLHPGVDVQLEAGGSVANARKIIDLKRSCDIIAVSDYKVIDEMLIPDHATWNIRFAANEMVIAFTDHSKYHETVDSLNWFSILSKDDVRFARSDPNQDPCGYRTVHTLKLAEKHYRKPGLADLLQNKDNQYIRPKEVDLIALLETNTVDYVFNYRSVAQQHHLPFLQLPAAINLKEPAMADLYGTVSTDISGQEPGQKITMTGEPMLYSLTILTHAPDSVIAMAFTEFLLSSQGQKIMEECGQPSVIPSESASYDQIPERLKVYAKRSLAE